MAQNNPPLQECQCIGLTDINELARRYRGKYNLILKASNTRKKGTSLVSRQNINLKLAESLENWERELNKTCIDDPYIYVENLVDDVGPPSDFTYIRESISTAIKDESSEIFSTEFLVGCECFPRCTPNMCSCPTNSGHKFAYDRSKRILLPPQAPVYECNKLCKCTQDCPNRVLQKGLTARVCIFRTYDGRGWGLQTRDFIPKNKFVIEYVGEIISTEAAEIRGKSYDAMQQTYLFDLDFNDTATFTIDAYNYGNVSHFINHSCEPNLRVHSVWVDTLDPRLPRIGLFATCDIQPDEELTFDYTCGQKPNIDGRELTRCACGSKKCRKFLF